MKKIFEVPMLDIQQIEVEDVITTSGGFESGYENETPAW